MCSLDGSLSFQLSVVYASNVLKERRELWAELTSMAAATDKAWAVLGDFSCVSATSEKLGGRPVCVGSTLQFNDCITEAELMDMK